MRIAAEGKALEVVAVRGFEFVDDVVDAGGQGVVDAGADAACGVAAEGVRCPAHGDEFLRVLQKRVFGKADAGEDEAAQVVAVAIHGVKGERRAAADHAERVAGQASCPEHGEVAVGAEFFRFVVDDGECAVGVFLCGEDFHRFVPQFLDLADDVFFDFRMVDAG